MFKFELSLDDRDVTADGHEVTIAGRVLARVEVPITTGGNSPGCINLGYRVFARDRQDVLFEHRAAIEGDRLDPNEWAPFRLVFQPPGNETNLRIDLDFVCEAEYWFHDRGGEVSEIALNTATGEASFSRILLAAAEPERPQPRPRRTPARAPRAGGPVRPRVIIDLSDLTQFWKHNIRPTGIQRVQIEVLKAIIDGEAVCDTVEPGVTGVFFDNNTHGWRVIDNDKMNAQINLSYSPTVSRETWNNELSKLLGNSKAYAPTPQDVILNLGSSWWIPDYLYKLQLLQNEHGVRYVPFIHDAIPLMTPQYCDIGLVDEFRLWFRGAVSIADAIVVNSAWSARDVELCANELVGSCPPISIARLNAAFPLPEARGHGIVERLNLDIDRYAICVGTLEARKNNALLFEVWNSLIKTVPRERMPKLLLVGKEGWMYDVAKATFNRYPVLKEYVLSIHNISDEDLAELYRRSIVNLYPSFYEGWGLPVTEATSYGKLTVGSSISSIPEAASPGDILLDPHDQNAWYETLYRLFTDDSYLEAREAESRAQANIRPWSAVALDILEALGASSPRPKDGVTPTLVDGAICDFRMSTAKKNFGFSAMPFRSGKGWHHMEDWGTWSAPGLTEIKFRSPTSETRYLYLTVNGGQDPLDMTLTMDRKSRVDRTVNAGERVIFRLEVDADSNEHVARIIVHNPVDLALKTNGADPRQIGLGFISMMVAPRDDYASRLNFLEAMQMHFVP